MKIIWTIVTLLLLGALIVLFQPPANNAHDALSAIDEPTTPTLSPEPITPTPPQPVTPPSATTPIPPITTPPVVPPKPTPVESSQQPSPEPKPPTASAIAAGSTFEPELPTIPSAELLPSKFVKLADGSISADDAWTIRGEGTVEAPYEVSWEFLASAQEDYMPRLGEKKLPARIAFLSGKRVRISGYLAFPLVAPTSSECLLMLNQWDGCCIGIPPTPYDAIEVKLATEIKGWKRHTINFGTIEGTFKVEPYLVENWLVGLYLFEGAKLDTEL